jgi:hypothetical protein
MTTPPERWVLDTNVWVIIYLTHGLHSAKMPLWLGILLI